MLYYYRTMLCIVGTMLTEDVSAFVRPSVIRVYLHPLGGVFTPHIWRHPWLYTASSSSSTVTM